jgi:hypothetical protein
MNILHILNVADWFLMAIGVAAALLMMLIGADGEPRPAHRGRARERRNRPDPR